MLRASLKEKQRRRLATFFKLLDINVLNAYVTHLAKNAADSQNEKSG